MKLDGQVTLLGIRHHGPGCAASLKRVLQDLQPDAILLEGAEELQASWHLAGDPEMLPPLAQVIYDPEHRDQAVYYPWGEFSPEWQAMRYAAATGTALLMMDLPMGIDFALRAEQQEVEVATESDEAGEAEAPVESPEPETEHTSVFDQLAQAAGFNDGELWWETTVEHQCSDAAMFAAIAEAMSAARAASTNPLSKRDALREAWMRKTLREARKQYQRIAVVCGAWHVPALAADIKAKDDNALLKGLKRHKTEVAWIPYLYSRFSLASGYGAGVASPAWYEHVYRHHELGGDRQALMIGWLAQVARLLRQHGFDCSSAQLIDAVQLAQNLAELRGLPLPGLAEMCDAAQSAMTDGKFQPLQIIEHELIIGTKLGSVPEHIPSTPLEQDLAAQCKKLRLERSALSQPLALDLRKDNGLARSVLLHRLQVLSVPWGNKQHYSSSLGSFKEEWTLCWQPEYSIPLIDAGRYGNTLAQAASQCLKERIATLDSVATLAETLEQIRRADLVQALPTAIRRLQDLAALSADLPDLMNALLSLVQELRYGSVRATTAHDLQELITSMVVRICNGLANACLQLDESAAYQMITAIDKTQAVIAALNDDAFRKQWVGALTQVLTHGSCPPLLTGRSTRLLYDLSERPIDVLQHDFRLATSAANSVTDAAAWLEGLLYRGAALLLYDGGFFGQLDGWLQALAEDDFMRVLPLLRRITATFNAAELGQLGLLVAQGQHRQENTALEFDAGLGAQALRTIGQLLGLEARK